MFRGIEMKHYEKMGYEWLIRSRKPNDYVKDFYILIEK